MAIAEMQEAVSRGADLVELRLDFLRQAPELRRFLAEKKCEIVATIRRVADGGRWSGPEDARKTLLRQCIVDVRDQLAAGKVERARSMLNEALNFIDAATDVVAPHRQA